MVAVTICSGRHYLLTEIEWRISQNNNDDICLPLCLLFLIMYARAYVPPLYEHVYMHMDPVLDGHMSVYVCTCIACFDIC